MVFTRRDKGSCWWHSDEMAHGPVLYCTVLCCTVLYCTVLYCTVLMRWSMSAQRLWPFTRPCPLELATNLSDVSTIKVKCPYKGNLSWCLIWFLNVKTLLAAFFHSLSLWLWNLREGSLQALFPTTVCHYSDPAQCCRWCQGQRKLSHGEILQCWRGGHGHKDQRDQAVAVTSYNGIVWWALNHRGVCGSIRRWCKIGRVTDWNRED